MNRRRFLQSGLAAALAAEPLAAAQSPAFPQGVASGDPAPDAVTLWTRVEPAALPGNPSTVAVRYEIAPNVFFLPWDIVASGEVETSAARDFTVKLRLESPALKPFTHYFYRFRVGDAVSPWGRFRTLPAPNQAVPRLRLAFLSCQDYTNGYYPALTNLLWENVDYVIHLGDYIYESTGDPLFQHRQTRPIGLLPSGATVAQTLDDYRFLYRIYRSDPGLQLAHALHPFLQIWDDHEFKTDGWRDAYPGGASAPALRQAANQAWSEYIPAATPFDPHAGPLDSLRIYRDFRFGTLAQLVLTDERLYRDGPPCGDDDRYVTFGCPELASPNRSMLGAEQKAWFLGRMADSPAVWNLWGNEVMAMALKVGYAQPVLNLNLDQWDGFPAERAELMTALVDVPNVIALTGDIHSFGAGYLHPDFLDPFSPRAGVEFISGSVSSANGREILESRASDASAFAPREALQEAFPSGLIEFLVRVNNPHVQFFNSDRHGYGILDITPQRTVCELKAVSAITSPNAAGSVLARFTIPRGSPQLFPW